MAMHQPFNRLLMAGDGLGGKGADDLARRKCYRIPPTSLIAPVLASVDID